MVLKKLAPLALLAFAACATTAPKVTSIDPAALPSRAPWTVLVFFSPTCHCLEQHDARLVALYEAYHARGVQFLMEDSEVRGTIALPTARLGSSGRLGPVGGREAGGTGSSNNTTSNQGVRGPPPARPGCFLVPPVTRQAAHYGSHGYLWPTLP